MNIFKHLWPLKIARVCLGSLMWLIFSTIPLLSFVPSHTFVLLSDYAAYSRQYELGTTYSFNYETSVLLNELQSSSPTKDVGFKVDLQVQMTPVWQHPSKSSEQILELEVSKNKLSVKAREGPTPSEFVEKASKPMAAGPFYIHRNGGLISKVYFSGDDTLSVINIKKGIASLFQYQLKEGTSKEIDSSGLCEVTYKQTEKNHLTKTKHNCQTIEAPEFFNHTNKVMTANVDSTIVTSYELSWDDSSIKKASAFESHTLRPEVRKNGGAEVLGRQIISFKGESKSSKKVQGNSASEVILYLSNKHKKSLVAEDLHTIVEPKECIACKSLAELVQNFRAALGSSSLGTQSSAVAFLRLLRKMRDSDFDKITSVLRTKKNEKILPQLLDIAAATQTVHSHKAVMKVLNFKGSIDLPERYLYALSVNTHPVLSVIEDLFKFSKKKIPNEKLYESLLLCLSAMTHTHSKASPNSEIGQKVKHFIVSSLDKCSHEACKLMYIRALKNLRCKSTLPVLMKFIRGTASKPAIYAMRALQTMPQEYFEEKVYRSLERVFLQLDSNHDWSVRSMALGILLKQRSSEVLLRDIFNILQNTNLREFNTLLLGQTLDLSKADDELSKLLSPFLNDHRLGNYHTLGQGGMSAMYSRPLVQSKEANASFSSVLEVNGGILKRSTVDVIISSEDADIRLFSFGVFAGGLSMLAGGEEAIDDGEEANAGIEITLMDSQLRPFVFFSGQGELMGHVWSGTASERTTALQGAVLLQDHNEYVALQNGFNINFILTGVVSYDVAGQVEISLWNRNAHSVVEVGAALVVQGQARLDSPYVQTMIEFNAGTQAQLNFISDLDFAKEVMMCLQMVQPSSEIIDSVRKLERVPESNYALRKYKRRVTQVPGKTYVVNRKNTEICSKMLPKKL